jgi:hypothetical protein
MDFPVIETIIQKRGFYLMHPESLKQYKFQFPRFESKLRARGIVFIELRSGLIKLRPDAKP